MARKNKNAQTETPVAVIEPVTEPVAATEPAPQATPLAPPAKRAADAAKGKLPRPGSIRAKLLLALTETPQTMKQLMAAVGTTETHYNYMVAMYRGGRIARNASGFYLLPNSNFDALRS